MFIWIKYCLAGWHILITVPLKVYFLLNTIFDKKSWKVFLCFLCCFKRLNESKYEWHFITYSQKAGVNFINILCAAFASLDPKSVKRKITKPHSDLRKAALNTFIQKDAYKILVKLTPEWPVRILEVIKLLGVSYEPDIEMSLKVTGGGQTNLGVWSNILSTCQIDNVTK